MIDPSGLISAEALAYEFIGSVAPALSWNVVGWMLPELFLMLVAGLSILFSKKAAKHAKKNDLIKAVIMANNASISGAPLPPNRGGRGKRVTSKTLYNKKGKRGFRIDVENPGTRPGQIHLQKEGVKYYYDIAKQVFRIGSSSGKVAPKSIQNLLKDPKVIKAIAKGLAILGY